MMPCVRIAKNYVRIYAVEETKMKIYYSDIRGADPSQALFPPLSSARGSAFGTSLLAAACEDFGGALPKITRLLGGRPVFANKPGLHFSISHSRTHVLVALSKEPVGADTLDHRAVRAETEARLATPDELASFTIHELWALRESFFKLTGEGDLRTMRFCRENGISEIIKGPRGGVYFKLFTDIADSSTAVASFDGEFPDKLIEVPVQKLLKRPWLLS